MRHSVVPLARCTLHHTNCLCDRIQHVIQEEPGVFGRADHVVIEQQPPCGHTAVEQILFSEFRSRAHLVSPVSMQKVFGLRGLDYEARKVRSKELFDASPIVDDETKACLGVRDRSHDVYDAFMVAEFWLHRQRLMALRSPPQNPPKPRAADGPRRGLEEFPTVDEFLSQFAFSAEVVREGAVPPPP